MSEALITLQHLFSEATRHGVPAATVHALIQHAQDMEADRIATLLAETLEQPERLANIDGDVIVRKLVEAIRARVYRPETHIEWRKCSCGHAAGRHNSVGCVDCECRVGE